jgi:lipoate-protein ligase A
MNVHHGIIKSFEYNSKDCSPELLQHVRSLLVGQRLQDIRDWSGFLRSRIRNENSGISGIAKCLDEFLPIPEEPSP